MIGVALLLQGILEPILSNLEGYTMMFNCGVTDLVVQPSGRVIQLEESFVILGSMKVDPKTGIETVYLLDGSIEREDLYICEEKTNAD